MIRTVFRIVFDAACGVIFIVGAVLVITRAAEWILGLREGWL